MKTLKLTLKKGWFDMVLSGEKNEEYREIKSYWIPRLLEIFSWDENKYPVKINKGSYLPKAFEAVEFTNGYSKSSRMVTVECLGIDTGVGLYVLGAPNVPVFRIKLGKEVCRLNC